ncbi:hypothetical protein MIN45_P0132 [Methylomarinovum tepidoasis]|uniref:DUF1640 domain-containing protein n=1 Tax=Methylomarinovum tepidoasis TaxID=2840183 RepID=A0AAU9C5W8_9GAMM|nr:hypothetical protein [Methylomarinovum sp. IN45]BCX87765.1 hypothetical protein MIN45_P0132 [Methylomarinovum sp. IN45]
MHVPIEIYQLLEDRLGREEAKKVAESIEVSLAHLEERSREIAAQRKLEAKEELKHELRNELATKEDLANLRTELKEDIANVRTELKEDIANLRTDVIRMEARLERKFTILWLITLFTIVFLNQNALHFLARLLGLLK